VEVEKDKVRVKKINVTKDRSIEIFENDIIKKLYEYGFTPPTLKDLSKELNQNEDHLRDIIERLVYEGKIIKVKGDMYFHRDVIENLKEKVMSYLRQNKEMTPSDFKSTLDLSRKYMIPLLEYLDKIKLTIRIGDKRILRS
jgi:selenocysteine-specific elongation factor